VQNEEYLSAADLSVIRRRKRHLWASEDEDSAIEELIVPPSDAKDPIFSNVHHNIAKRSFDYCFSQSSNTTMCLPIGSGALTAGLMALIFAGAKLTGIFAGRNNRPPTQPPVQVSQT
jgi:hypothetical protein